MFLSITNLFSVQIKNPYTGKVLGWFPLENEQQVITYLKKWDWPYKVVTVFNEQILTVTHRFCKRMLWGFDGFGIGMR